MCPLFKACFWSGEGVADLGGGPSFGRFVVKDMVLKRVEVDSIIRSIDHSLGLFHCWHLLRVVHTRLLGLLRHLSRNRTLNNMISLYLCLRLDICCHILSLLHLHS